MQNYHEPLEDTTIHQIDQQECVGRNIINEKEKEKEKYTYQFKKIQNTKIRLGIKIQV